MLLQNNRALQLPPTLPGRLSPLSLSTSSARDLPPPLQLPWLCGLLQDPTHPLSDAQVDASLVCLGVCAEALSVTDV